MRTTPVAIALTLIVSCGVAGDDGSAGNEIPTTTTRLTSTTVDDLPYTPRPDPPRVTSPSLIPEWFVDDGPLPESLDSAARSLISETADVPAADLVAAGAMAVTWSDSALGCPQPGQMYLQVLTDGYLAFYSLGGRVFRVHTDTGYLAIICTLPDLGEPNPSS